MNTAICQAVENITALNKRDAAALADKIIDAVIDALRRDPAIPSRTFAAWSLQMADLRARVAEQITAEIEGRVDLDEVLSTIESVG